MIKKELLTGFFCLEGGFLNLIKSFCRGVQGGQFFQKAPPLAAGGNSYVEK